MRAVITIRGVRNIAARVTHTGRDDAGPLADQILHAPENILLREQRADALSLLYLIEIFTVSSDSISSRGMKRRDAELMQ